MIVREARVATGLSQEKVAQHLDVSRQTVNYIESGRHEPRVGIAIGMAQLYGLAVEVLFADWSRRESS